MAIREIIFRGKRTDNGQWAQGSLLAEGSRVEIIRGTCNNVGIESVEVIPETVGQYTGLTDKSGTKIFEGDIVQVISTLSDNGKHIVVRFDGKRGGWLPFANGDGCGCCEYETYAPNGDGVVDCVELVGNIHDNPELLGAE